MDGTDRQKEILYEAEDQNAGWFEEISHEIFTHPELGDQEFYSSDYLAREMEKAGFCVTYPYCGLPTAFRCEYGDTEGPVVAFLAEYDALPGYGPHCDRNGHACGHNWIAASAFGAAVSLKIAKEKIGFPGRIVCLGTPAEETTSRKITLIEQGAFRDIDAVFQMHLGVKNRTDPTALAMTILQFEFIGVAAHASSAPERGVNALDACQLTFAGINALRQHVKSDVRIHGIIRDGGTAPNVVPEHSLMEVYVRAADKDYLEEVIAKVCNCARGAELMTGAKLTLTRDRYTTYDIRNNPVLVRLLTDHLRDFGIVPETVPSDDQGTGSTDIGNVSYEVPTCYAFLGTEGFSGARVHEEAFLEVADSEYARRLLHIGAKSMGAAALDLFLHPEIAREVREQGPKRCADAADGTDSVTADKR